MTRKQIQERILTILIILLIITLFLSSCKTKEKLIEKEVETETVVDSTYKEKFDSLYTAYQSEVSSYEEYTKIIETQLKSYIQGTAGDKSDTIIKNLEKQRLLLTQGRDTFVAEGAWTYFDYSWNKAPCESVYESREDSSTKKETYYKSVISSYESEIKSLEERYESLKKEESKVKTIKTINWKWTLSGWFVAIIVFLYFKFRKKIKRWLI